MSEGLLPEEVAAILRVADEVDFTELSLRSGDTTITLRRGGQEVTAPSVQPAATPRSAAPVPATAEPPLAAAGAHGPAAQIDPARTTIVSPLLGTFYRRSGPAEDPFVEVGSEVGAGSVVCIVEVMKMMNSIQSGVEGRITEVLVEDGQLVESGTELFVVEAL